MTTPEVGANAQHLIREGLGANAIKRLARALDCPVNTCKSLLHNHFSKHRAREVIAACLEEMEREARRKDEIRAELRRMLGE